VETKKADSWELKVQEFKSLRSSFHAGCNARWEDECEGRFGWGEFPKWDDWEAEKNTPVF
jgi:hypothetical protein